MKFQWWQKQGILPLLSAIQVKNSSGQLLFFFSFFFGQSGHNPSNGHFHLLRYFIWKVEPWRSWITITNAAVKVSNIRLISSWHILLITGKESDDKISDEWIFKATWNNRLSPRLKCWCNCGSIDNQKLKLFEASRRTISYKMAAHAKRGQTIGIEQQQ